MRQMKNYSLHIVASCVIFGMALLRDRGLSGGKTLISSSSASREGGSAGCTLPSYHPRSL
jgi:hypothetical protein